MTSTQLIKELQSVSRSFGPAAADRKKRLLGKIARLSRLSAKNLRDLQGILEFLRAYPDNPAVLGAVHAVIENLRGWSEKITGSDPAISSLLNCGVAGAAQSYSYSYYVLKRLVRIFPGSLGIDWDALEKESELNEALSLTLTLVESQGLEDASVSLSSWFDQCKSKLNQTDLEFLIERFENSELTQHQQVHAFEGCDVPCLFYLDKPGSGRCEISLPVKTIHYQRAEVSRDRFPLAPKIRRHLEDPCPLSEKEGRQVIGLATMALCSRNLEIYPLVFANAKDVRVVPCGRGITVLLLGTLPEFRSALESLFVFLIFKNGVPMAYGPAGVFDGCCEMGINLFPEFRGGEIRYIYSQFMRALYHMAHVRYFFVTAYGMGEDNEEAIQSGAFWFYRKLGFKPERPKIEEAARREEASIKSKPGYRSPRSMLRKLSHSDVIFDLSSGKCCRHNFGRIGLSISRFIAGRFEGDRKKATLTCRRRLIRLLEIPWQKWNAQERAALDRLSVALMAIPDLVLWTKREKLALAKLIRVKGAASEAVFAKSLPRNERLRKTLYRMEAGEDL